MSDNWTELAPAPVALPQSKNWHVFVSYRSANRSWVLALYDILRGLGYKVFPEVEKAKILTPFPLAVGPKG